MAWRGQNNEVTTVSLEAGQSFTGRVNRVVRLNSNGQVVETTGVATDTPIGVIATDPGTGHASGDAVSVALIDCGGIHPVQAGDGVTRGNRVGLFAGTGANAGQVGAAPAAGSFGVGVALNTVSAGSLVNIVLKGWQE